MDNLSFIPDDYEEVMEGKDLRSIEVEHAIATLTKHGYFTTPSLLWHTDDLSRLLGFDLTEEQLDAIVPIINAQLDSYAGEYICDSINVILKDIMYQYCYDIITKE